MYVKYDKYRVVFEDSGLDYNGEPKVEGKYYNSIHPGYVAIKADRNIEDFENSIIDFYKSVFHGERIAGIERFEPLSRKEIKELREKYRCGFDLFCFKKDDKERGL